MTDTDDVPIIEVTIAAPAAEVWHALRDPALIRRWHGWQFDGLDEEIRVIYVDHATADDDRHVLVVDGGDRFTLHPVDGSTRVRVTRAPFGSNPEWDAYYEDINEGWAIFLQQLRFGLERHGLAERRTLLRSGTLRSPDVPLVTALGLAEAAELPVGARYRAAAVTGDTLEGRVFARTDRQRLFTVDGFGDGLLVVAEQPVTSFRPDGGSMILLTTYSLRLEEFAAVERRWTAWWGSVCAVPAAEPR